MSMLKAITQFDGHEDVINAVCYDDKDRVVFTASDDCTFMVWKPKPSGAYECSLVQYLPKAVSALAWDASRRRLVTGTDGGVVQVFSLSPDYEQCNEECVVQAHSDRVTAIHIDSQEDIFVSGGRDKYVRVYDFRTNSLYNGPMASGWITSLAYDPVGHRLFVGTYDVTILIMDISTRTPKILTSLSGHTGSIRCVAYDPRKKYLFSGSFDATVCIWDVGVPGREKFAQVVGKLSGHQSKVKAVAWHAPSRMVFSGGDDQKIIAWDTRSGTPKQTLHGGGDAIMCMSVSDASGVLVTANKDRSVRLFQISESEERFVDDDE